MEEPPPATTNPRKRKRNEWLKEEKNLFFQGVERFTSHRIEDIANHIGTRTPVEVAHRIDLLEKGLAEAKALGLLNETSAVNHTLNPEYFANRARDWNIQREERISEGAARAEDEQLTQEEHFYKKEERKLWKEKSGLFNLKLLTILAAKVYHRNDLASISRTVIHDLHSLLSHFLKRILTNALLSIRATGKPTTPIPLIRGKHIRSALSLEKFENKSNNYYVSHLLWTAEGREAFREHYGIDLNELAINVPKLASKRGRSKSDDDEDDEQDDELDPAGKRGKKKKTTTTVPAMLMPPWHEVPDGKVSYIEEEILEVQGEQRGELSAAFVVEDDDSSDDGGGGEREERGLESGEEEEEMESGEDEEMEDSPSGEDEEEEEEDSESDESSDSSEPDSDSESESDEEEDSNESNKDPSSE